jgi:hypothetical protein
MWWLKPRPTNLPTCIRRLFSLCDFDFSTACQNCKTKQTEGDCGNREIKTPAAEAAPILQV